MRLTVESQVTSEVVSRALISGYDWCEKLCSDDAHCTVRYPGSLQWIQKFSRPRLVALFESESFNAATPLDSLGCNLNKQAKQLPQLAFYGSQGSGSQHLSCPCIISPMMRADDV